MDGDPSAVLVVRVWLEGDTDQFRARLMTVGTTPGSGVGEEVRVTVAASPGDVVRAVRAWLEEFLDTGSSSIDGGE
jgi:aspartate/methionine/tyrosine aminotransferase